MIKIKITNFWPTAFENDFFNFFLHQVFESRFCYVDSVEKSDIVFSSVFGEEYSPKKKTIGFIGENDRPNFSKWSYSLSFDDDTWSGMNHPLPLWYQRLQWPGYQYVNMRANSPNETHGHEELISINSLVTPRTPITLKEFNLKKFCAAIWGNPEPFRTNLFYLLSNYIPVDGFGKAFQKPLYQSKLDLLVDYKFSICPENSIYPGYITEKLIDAWAGGCIPIYSGQFSREDKIFNTTSFLNYQDHLNIESIITRIKDLDANLELYNEIYIQPILNYEPSLTNVIMFTRQKVSDILLANST